MLSVHSAGYPLYYCVRLVCACVCVCRVLSVLSALPLVCCFTLLMLKLLPHTIRSNHTHYPLAQPTQIGPLPTVQIQIGPLLIWSIRVWVVRCADQKARPTSGLLWFVLSGRAALNGLQLCVNGRAADCSWKCN